MLRREPGAKVHGPRAKPAGFLGGHSVHPVRLRGALVQSGLCVRHLDQNGTGRPARRAELGAGRDRRLADGAGARHRRAGDRAQPGRAAIVHPRGDRPVRTGDRTPRARACRGAGRGHRVAREPRHALERDDCARDRHRGAVRAAVRPSARAAVRGLGLLMDLFANLATGFGAAVTPVNLGFCLFGCLIGTLIGVLPGIGPIATIAMLLPVTFGLSPLGALIMLAGIYYGAQYGGSTTAILVNLPGEVSSVVTCLDGYQMARKGQAGKALGIAALGSFFAGCVATVLIAGFAPPLAELALKFGPADYFSLMVLGLIAAVGLAHGSLVKAIAMIVLGLLMGLIGTDVNSGVARYSFNLPELIDGVGIGTIAMGMFGFSEIVRNLEQGEEREIFTKSVTGLWPNWSDIKQAFPAVCRGTVLGSMLGILPGGGPVLGSFSAYTLEKKLAKDPSRFGKGAIEGVAAPESANNAAAQTSFIPLLTLGIPSNPVMALMIGAMIIHGIQPGPQIMTAKPELFWGMIASMWVGNALLVILNLPLIGMWVKLLTVKYDYLFPAILIFCCIGVYSISNAWMDVLLAALFGFIGYVFIKLEVEPAPLLLGFVLGPMMEENLRRALLLSRGDPAVFFTRPISLTLLVISAVLIVIVAAPGIAKKREEAFQEG